MINSISSSAFKFVFLTTLISMLFACGADGGSGDGANNQNNNQNISSVDNTKTSIGYIETANIVVAQLWIRDTDGVEQQLLTAPETVKLVPSVADFSKMQIGLDIPAGDYDRVRLVLESGEVVLLDGAVVAGDLIFNTESDDFKFPSGYQTGIKVNIEPPIKVVSTLSQDLVLSFDLTKSFVFNGPITHEPGVKRVLFKPVIQASNDSTHGRIILNVSGESSEIKCNPDNPVLEDVMVTAIDTSGLNPDVTINADEQGNVSMRLLPGNYDILIEAPDYQSVTILSNDVYIANKTVLENTTLGKEGEAVEFNKDIGVLLSIMSDLAYKTGLSDYNQGSHLISNFTYEYDTSANNVISQYSACWKIFSYIDSDNTQTQLFIAYNDNTGDLAVSFAGTAADTDKKDLIVDGLINKSDWVLDNGSSQVVYPDAVHTGFLTAYNDISLDLRHTLDGAISGANKVVTNPATSRVYFTGHSLGGSLATLASLDLVNYLINKYGYQKNNIIMYSIGASRSFTDNQNANSLRADYKINVPNAYAVIAKDDFFPTFLGAYSGGNSYAHIENLVVLSTNVIDGTIDTAAGPWKYTKIGNTRIEHSHGERYTSCFASTGIAGHSSKQYIRRLEKSTSGTIDIPNVDIEVIYKLVFGYKLQLNWDGGVSGPCDKVWLYVEDKGFEPENGGGYFHGLNAQYQWAVNNDGFPNYIGSYDTDKNPYKGTGLLKKFEDKDFWVGYEDGFGRIINKICLNCSGVSAPE